MASAFDIPDEYKDRVNSAAAKHGVSPQLLASIIWNESRWNPNARAVGDQTGSINPATGKPYDSVGITQWGEQWAKARGFDPMDPSASIDATGKVIREHTDKYGNPLLARLAYGWGAGNVDGWLKAGGDPTKIPEGAKTWLPRTAFGMTDDKEARAAFDQVAPMLKPGMQRSQPAQPAMNPVAGDPAFDAMRTAGDADMAGYGASPAAQGAPPKKFDNSGLLSAGMGLMQQNQEQAAAPQKPMPVLPAHRGDMNAAANLNPFAGLLADPSVDPQKKRQLFGLLGA